MFVADVPHAAGMGSTSGASLVGRDLYDKVITFLTSHCQEWLKVGSPRVGDDILTFFADMWQRCVVTGIPMCPLSICPSR
jgi:hypothetical protein